MDPQQLTQLRMLMTSSIREAMAVQSEQQASFLPAAQTAALANASAAQGVGPDHNASAHRVLSLEIFSRLTKCHGTDAEYADFAFQFKPAVGPQAH